MTIEGYRCDLTLMAKIAPLPRAGPPDKRFFLLEASARGAGGGLYAASAYYAAKVSATAPLNVAVAMTFDLIGCARAARRRGGTLGGRVGSETARLEGKASDELTRHVPWDIVPKPPRDAGRRC
jgi:hypothetical protein